MTRLSLLEADYLGQCHRKLHAYFLYILKEQKQSYITSCNPAYIPHVVQSFYILQAHLPLSAVSLRGFPGHLIRNNLVLLLIKKEDRTLNSIDRGVKLILVQGPHPTRLISSGPDQKHKGKIRDGQLEIPGERA